ncbi:MAG: hypothetical protein KAS95_03480 [Candidatus Heimdallarchaeota archaeon]|nr:hypothetical protein [Candidatus Heimdallarchaeota archaeon]
MKRKNIHYLTVILLLSFLVTNISSTDVQSATSGDVLEDFSTTNYRDTSNTNVTGWGGGQIELPRQNPIYQDTIVAGIANNVFVDGSYAYVGSSDGYYIIDISVPDSLSQTGNYTDAVEVDWIYGSDIEGNLAYIANGNYGLLVLDITDKTNPIKHSEFDLPSVSSDIKVHNKHAFIPVYSGGLRVVNVSDASNPYDEGGYIPTTSDAYGVAISGNYLFIAVSHAGLDVYDISTPASPEFVSNVDLDGYAKKVEVSGNYAYVVCDLGGLQIVDVSDPTNMTRVAHLDGNIRYHGVDVKGNYVYVTGYSSSIKIMRIYDISNPENPIASGFYNLANSGFDVFVSGDYAYVAATTVGLYSLKIADSGLYYGELYDFYAVAQSSNIYYATTGEIIEKVTLSVSEYYEPETSINYYVSADGGDNWESITPEVEHIFTNTGMYLKWKAELSTIDEGTTPVVYYVALDYVTIDVEMVLLYPIHDSYIAEQTPNFDWEDMPGAYGYLLQLDISPSFTTLILNESLFFVESNYTISTPLDEETTYYWRVAFYIDYSTLGRFSDVLNFIVGEEPVVAEFGTLSIAIFITSFIGVSSAMIFRKRKKA